MPAVARSRNPLWSFQSPSITRMTLPEGRRNESDKGKLLAFAVTTEHKRRLEHRKQLLDAYEKERETREQRALLASTAQKIASSTLETEREAATRREKTMMEEVDAWGAGYQKTKANVTSATMQPAYNAQHQNDLLQKQLLLPRRNTIQKDMPQWFQRDAENMPDWFGLRKILNSTQPLNLFQRSESGSLTRFKSPDGRSHSTEPRMPKVQTRERSFRLPDGQFESDVPNVQGGQIKSSSQSPIARKENNMEVDSLERRFEMQKRDEEFYAKIATSPMASITSPLKKGFLPDKTLVSGSLMSPADELLQRQSPLRTSCLPPTHSLSSTIEEYTGKLPPFAMETESRDLQPDPPPSVCNIPVKADKTDQFAWWSRHWGDLTASKEKSLDGSAQVIKVKPIKPVDNFWKGNYQKRPVPWRKEQLGAFPSYKDFPWPPPHRSLDQQKGDLAVARYLAKHQPWGSDRICFKGPSETSMNKLVFPVDRYIRQCPDFTDKRSDLSNSFTSLPEGKAWRPRSTLGWSSLTKLWIPFAAGYRQSKDNVSYDNFSRRLFASQIDKMLGITADKLVEHGVTPSAGNFLLAFAHFEDQPKTGYLSRKQFHAALYHFGAVFSEAGEEDFFDAFAITSSDGDRKVCYHTLSNAIDERGLAHPLTRAGNS